MFFILIFKDTDYSNKLQTMKHRNAPNAELKGIRGAMSIETIIRQ